MSSGSFQYDLVPCMLPYLDKHLIFPLLEFLQQKNIYEKKVMLQAKYDLLVETYMTDYIISLSQEMSLIDPLFKSCIEFNKKREEETEMFDLLNTESQKVLKVLDNPEVIVALKQDKAQNLQYLKDSHGLTVEMINSLYKFGKFQYNSGNYASAVDLLYHFRALSIDNELNVSATWGKLASEILTVNWERALEEVNKLKDIIDSKNFSSPIFQLKHRTWLIHWSLFPFFNHETGKIALCELFFSPSYMNTIQTSCPWILRYLTVAVITTRSQVRNAMHYQRRMKELIKVIDQELYEYTDPVIQFIKVLYIQFDFEDAQNFLKEAEEVLKNDFFLVGTCSEFVDSAHYLMAEAYYLNAKIDFKEGTIVMNHISQPIYQQVIERTKGLNFRTQVLAQTIARRQQGDKKETIPEIAT
ncbi:hypothetical protein PMAC_001631 [Pneumocystis sp. 'macacae']|nr:hypothetical protein PMAC_001631 [Pneumocystis sp. 'macacae']